MAAEMATIVGDVTGLQQRHHPLNIPPLVEKIKGFPLKAKSTYQKLRGDEFHQPPPPPPLYHGGGMTLRVRPRVKRPNKKTVNVKIFVY